MPSCKICIPLVNKMPTDTGEQRCCNKMEKKTKKTKKTTLFFVKKKQKNRRFITMILTFLISENQTH